MLVNKIQSNLELIIHFSLQIEANRVKNRQICTQIKNLKQDQNRSKTDSTILGHKGTRNNM